MPWRSAPILRGIVGVICLVWASVGTCQDEIPQPAATEPAPAAAEPAAEARFEQDASYVLGMNFGRDMRQNGVRIDMNAFVAGFTDAQKGDRSRISEEDAQKCMAWFQQQMQKRAEAEMAELQEQLAAQAPKHKAAGEAFLAQNGSKPGVKTTESGLQYKVLKAGPAGGKNPLPTSVVETHYEGRLLSGEVFDSSYERGETLVIDPRQIRVIDGWIEVLQLMKPGDQWEVYIPSELAYKEDGMPPNIPPNSTLIFKMELVRILK